MLEFRGKIVTISECNSKKYRIKEFGCNWTDKMFEGLAEYTYDDLCKSPIGTKIMFENKKVLVKDSIDTWENYEQCRDNEGLKNLKDNYEDLGKIIKIEEPSYTTVYEVQDILDEAEKE